ncbi:MAG: diaminopimelate decarboxylase [delta proteobacterium ML8_D]|jgi:diaminopimelate decarboxylase|nr:MAG: diaminopimelate decarboxylase [delta proteobacterium ML8_D]
MNHFHYKDKELCCENIPVKEIANKVKTPFYLYSSATLTHRFNAFDKAFSGHPHLICFAVKANSNLTVLNLLAELGAGADIVSGGELYRALKAGIPADKIVYSGVGKTEKEIREAAKADILMFNVESMEELDAISRQARRLKRRIRISFRVNPDVNANTHPYISTGLKKNKFGLPMSQALEAYKVASNRDELDVVGIDCHIGSQLIQVEPFVDAIRRIKFLLGKLDYLGIKLNFIDIGGGLGIKYQDEIPPEPDAYARALLSEIRDLSHCLIVEPGRSIVGNAGILVTKILYTKDTGEKRFYIVDAAMNDLARPALYEAYHKILPVIKTDAHLHPADIVGPICETGDFLARERPMPDLNQGDLLAIMSAGAYGFSMSSNYNSRPRVPEVMVRDDHFRVIRKRETYARLLLGETIW